MSSAVRPRSVQVRAALLPALVVAALVAILGLLASPSPVRADCATNDAACIEVDRTSGAPDTLVTMVPLGPGCVPGLENRLEWVDGSYDWTRTYPISPLTVAIQGGARRASFIVPQVPPATYALALRCEADIVDGDNNPYGLLPFTFTVLAAPATDTDPVASRPGESSGIPVAPIALAALAALLIELVVPRQACDRRP